jgi:uncharacterized membrane protein
MSLANKAQKWVEAELLTSDQADGILAFEKNRSRPTFLYAVGGLGGLAIAIGMVSIVAANWGAISGQLKVAFALALVATTGACIARGYQSGPRWAIETAILVEHGMVLATIALIGQVYQLGGDTHLALTFWLGLMALLVSCARGGVVAWVWLVSLEVTYFTWLVVLADDHGFDELLCFGAVVWAPLACLAVGQSAWVRRHRLVFARTFEAAGWGQLVLMASLGTQIFYFNKWHDEAQGLLSALAVSVVATAVLLGLRLRRSRANAGLLVVCVALIYLPLLTSPGRQDLFGALGFLGLWVLVAFAAFRAGRLGLLNLATAVVGVRLLVVYFEVFGSMLSTGVGLVSGGVLTVALVWLWTRKRREFGAELAEEAP